MKISEKVKSKLRGCFFDSIGGFTLIEVIVTIGISGFSIITILGLYSIKMDMEKTAKNFFEQSLEINSIKGSMEKILGEEVEFIDGIELVIKNYPEYSLGNIKYEENKKLREVEIIFKASERHEKSYFLLFYNE